jgi:hypothetical protein
VGVAGGDVSIVIASDGDGAEMLPTVSVSV